MLNLSVKVDASHAHSRFSDACGYRFRDPAMSPTGISIVSPVLVGCSTVLWRGKNWVFRWYRADGRASCDDK